jgi:peptidoglycan/LPS O-acetylase OafA/YrhL
MKITYRPEIDGLRALAVVAVILYHSKIAIYGHQPFKGGFIGVDIFFVISGYLITSIILKELVTTGSFSFKHFYERRIRRILPALLFVILVSLPFAWMYLLPSRLIDFSKTILYSLGFSSNFYFWYSGQQYFDGWSMYKPFLHTWSLSVEEQYYILFPIVLLIAFKYLRKYLINILIFLTIISLLLAQLSSKTGPSANFYFLYSRMWELLSGSILAYFEITLGHRSKNQKMNCIFPSIGLLLIFHYILFYDDKILHPSFYTLPPIIGVCLIIWFSQKDELVTKIFSTKLFVGIGLISYSLYLWHFPIFSFMRLTGVTPGDSLIKKLGLFIIILLISFISYYFVEQPFRNKNNKFKIIISLIIFSIALISVYNVNIIHKEGYINRLPDILQNSLSTNHENSINNKIFSKKKVYLLGDSHMESLNLNLNQRLVDKNYSLLTSTIGSCLFFPNSKIIHKKTLKIIEDCNDDKFKKFKKILLTHKNSIIILGGRFPLYLSNFYFDNQEGGIELGNDGSNEWDRKIILNKKGNTLQDSFKNHLLEISKNNQIILVYPIPEVGFDINNKIYLLWIKNKNSFNKNLSLANINTSYQIYKKRTKSSFELLDSVQGDNIYRVYPHRIFCNTIIKNRCTLYDEKNIFYYDDDHPSLKGAQMINDLILNEIEKIELRSK